MAVEIILYALPFGKIMGTGLSLLIGLCVLKGKNFKHNAIAELCYAKHSKHISALNDREEIHDLSHSSRCFGIHLSIAMKSTVIAP